MMLSLSIKKYSQQIIAFILNFYESIFITLISQA